MIFYVYMLLAENSSISYVGYTKNLYYRLNQHNSGRGAKFTRGRKWKLIYKQAYSSKSDAIKNEYKLKKDTKLRNKIKLKYIKK